MKITACHVLRDGPVNLVGGGWGGGGGGGVEE